MSKYDVRSNCVHILIRSAIALHISIQSVQTSMHRDVVISMIMITRFYLFSWACLYKNMLFCPRNRYQLQRKISSFLQNNEIIVVVITYYCLQFS